MLLHQTSFNAYEEYMHKEISFLKIQQQSVSGYMNVPTSTIHADTAIYHITPVVADTATLVRNANAL
ncbi:MAG: hypothetical protein J7K58_02590 [Euryarchaeota archaeon]|nr:hypothetical protein [Euryarchaeota archaeon]